MTYHKELADGFDLGKAWAEDDIARYGLVFAVKESNRWAKLRGEFNPPFNRGFSYGYSHQVTFSASPRAHLR